jgi:hypothetical protein
VLLRAYWVIARKDEALLGHIILVVQQHGASMAKLPKCPQEHLSRYKVSNNNSSDESVLYLISQGK